MVIIFENGKIIKKENLTFSLHVGADADMTNKIGVDVKALDAISAAIATVSAQRSLLGAVQNRLERTINNLDNVVENTTAAESQIRDTDMATEMVKYSNANIINRESVLDRLPCLNNCFILSGRILKNHFHSI